MLQRLDDRMMAHDAVRHLADRRAMEHQAQHPQIMGAGRMGKKKIGLEDARFNEEEEEEVHGGAMSSASRLHRLVGGRRKPSAREVGEKHLEAHEMAHEAMSGGAKRSEAYLQGGALSKHLRELHGEGFWDDFKKGFMSVVRPVAQIAKPILAVVPHPAAKAAALGMSALGLGKHNLHGKGVVDAVTGATQRGRVANPPASFARNTVGMGVAHGEGVRRHRVVESLGGEYADEVHSGVTHMEGSGLFSPLKKFGERIARSLDPTAAPRPRMKTREQLEGGAKRKHATNPNDARKRRGAEVSRLMREQGMSLGEASKHVKEHGY
jgi:hypothetical protein